MSNLHRLQSAIPKNRLITSSAHVKAQHIQPCFAANTSLTKHCPTSTSSIRNPALPRHQLSHAATMATMRATSDHSQACCNTPPVVPEGYEAKGKYEELGGRKTYVTGSTDATKGLVSIFDVFGYFSQTLQGADILAAGQGDQNYKVFIPDWFNDNPVPIEWYPPTTEEQQKKLGEWFGQNDPHGVANALPDYVKALQKANPSIKSWGIFGYCWGGKVVELVTSTHPDLFVVAGAAHPAMVDPAGADKISVPYIMLASGEEPVEAVKDFEGKLTVPHHVETFSDQGHGFMAARADLSDPRVKEEYARGYATVLEFFGKHWN